MTVEELIEELHYLEPSFVVKVRVHHQPDTRSLTDDVRIDEEEGEVILHTF